MSLGVENRSGLDRIRVRQDGENVELVPGIPTLSSAGSPWEGVLFERHFHGPFTTRMHQHLSHFICVHLSEPAPFIWRSRLEQGKKTIQSGSVILVSRGAEDSIAFPKAVKRILLNLEPSLLKRALPEGNTSRDVEFIHQWGVRDPQTEYTVRALEADLEAGLPTGKLFGESLLCALAIHLQNRYAVTPPTNWLPRNGLPKARLNRVIEYVDAHLDQEIRLSALAETAGMSAHYFSELFKQSAHLSPHQFVLRRRIDRARELLSDPAIAIHEAALGTGFSNLSHFTKVFRRITGMTPTSYRAAL
jgi:AraC family transcriptional regulator